MFTRRGITYGITALGLLVTMAISIYSASFAEDEDASVAFSLMTIILELYIVSPYIALFALTRNAYRSNRVADQVGVLVAASFVTVFNSWMYTDAVFISTSSTSAIVFMVLPFYSLIAIGVIFYGNRMLTGRK